MKSVKRWFFLPVLLMVLLPGSAMFAGNSDPQRLQVVVEDGVTSIALPGETPFHTTSEKVTGDRLLELPGSRIRVALWNQTDAAGTMTPYYAIGRDGAMGEGKATSYRLRLRHGEFDPEVFVPEVEAGFRSGKGSRLYLVQFETQPLEEYREAIQALGGRIDGFLADNSQIVAMDPETRNQVADLPYVRWIGPYHPAYRLPPVPLGDTFHPARGGSPARH